MKQNKLIIFMPSIENGGVEKNLFIIANYLAQNIDNITLITASKKFNHKFKNITVINPKINLNKSNGRKIRYFFCLIELLKLLIKKNSYVLFAFQANLYCALIAIFFPKLKIITRSNSSPTGWSKNYYKKLLFKLLFKRIDKVIVNSFTFKKELRDKFNINPICIYNPLNKEDVVKLSKKKLDFKFFNTNKLKIINIGRLVDQKDQLTFLKSLILIKKKIDFRALIIGSGEKKYELVQFIKKNNLKKNVRIINFKSNPYSYLKKSDLMIHTAIYEGLPNVLLEALALKKYTISTDCPTGPSEILSNGKGGGLVKVHDYRGIAKKVLEFSNNKKNKKKINYASKTLKRFDYNKNLDKYLRLVNNFIN